MMRRIFATTILGVMGLGVAIAPAVAQDASKQSVFESVALRSGFNPDPYTLQGVSGGDAKAMTQLGVQQTPTGACLGYIDERADHRIELKTYFNYLKLAVESTGDTVLAVRGPGGTWCNDDSSDQDPVIAGEWQPGPYEVWVGSRQDNEFHPYSLQLTQVK
ncbi:hypothetical protein Lepto7376_2734 [[Leptolyngbya] sp. PCC 7376]|uniref:hypothetical protein n=1 Tax=[Leptolyngbya] sp. PCC 7376 TaxID=111781 RepID=UPI00029F3F59|nr:hypothetical protein [[Leptolyngbya] sp. PCC 7376]AFY38995.1 hypothetical protein Lepto7376_2734 [[Leptolyngbya] sp. PCC 7376]